MRRLTNIVIGVVLTAATLTIQADAANASFSCSLNYICFYTGDNGTGFVLPKQTGRDVCTNLPATWNDHVKSIHNNTNYLFMVYQHAGCTGGNDLVYAKSSGNMNWYWDTQMSSFMRIS